MDDILFEQQVVQNPGLGAEAIWTAVQEAYEGNNRRKGYPIMMVFVVLPLVFHRKSATSLSSKVKPGALYKAISAEREMLLGLQERMEALSDRTLESLSIGFSSKLLLLDNDSEPQLIPGRKSPPVTHVTEDVKSVLTASKRVGQAISELSQTQIATHLNIRF